MTNKHSSQPNAQLQQEAAQWLLRLREDQLSEDETRQWLRWCEAHPDNLRAFERIQKLWRAIPVQLEREMEADLLPPLRNAQRIEASHERFVRAGRGWAIAAGLIGFIVCLPLAYRAFVTPSSAVQAKIEAPLRVNESSVLPDGSRVALGAGSTVALDFTHKQRRLDMQDGMAFFDVKPDKARPFVVHAGPISVTAVGTAFNVRRNGGRVVVTVEEGKVRIENAGKAIEAEAGYQLAYDSRSGEARLSPVNPAAELSWREGRLVYNGEPLEFVIATVNQYSAKPITLSDPALGRLKFTGTVLTDSIDTWLTALPNAFPITVKEADGRLVLEPVR